jgi:hypothetical protein
MSYTQLPTRTSSDTNASADVNTLQDNIEALKGGSGAVAPTTTIEALATAVSALSVPDYIADFPTGSWDFDPAQSSFPAWETDVGTNGNMRGHYFDDTTEEFLEASFILPSAIAGTVTFEAYGYSKTAVASRYIELKLYHSAKADGEGWDAAYANKESGDLLTDSTQDNLNRFTWTETVTNLTWTANDQVRIKLSRIAPSGTNLSGDWILTHFRVIVPRA